MTYQFMITRNRDKKVSEYDQEYHNHILQTEPQHNEEEPQTFTVTIHLYDNNSKATSFLLFSNMIA